MYSSSFFNFITVKSEPQPNFQNVILENFVFSQSSQAYYYERFDELFFKFYFTIPGRENAIGGLVGDTFPMICGGFNLGTLKDCYIFNGSESKGL